MCLNIIAFAEYFCRTYMHQEVTRLIQFTPHFVIASSLIIGVLVQCVTNIGSRDIRISAKEVEKLLSHLFFLPKNSKEGGRHHEV